MNGTDGFGLQPAPGAAPRVIPWISDWAAGLAGLSYREMSCSPTLLANRLQEAAQVLGAGGITCLFDPVIMAEAAGADLDWPEEAGDPQPSRLPRLAAHPFARDPGALAGADPSEWLQRGRWPAVLEAARRLVQTVGRQLPVLGVLPTPGTLARHLCGLAFPGGMAADQADLGLEVCGEAITSLARTYGEIGAQGLVLLEEPPLGPPDTAYLDTLAEGLTPTWNTARFYELACILVVKNGAGLPDHARRRYLALGGQYTDLGEGAPMAPLRTADGRPVPVITSGWAIPAGVSAPEVRAWIQAARL